MFFATKGVFHINGTTIDVMNGIFYAFLAFSLGIMFPNEFITL
jgi:hypothetical protein